MEEHNDRWLNTEEEGLREKEMKNPMEDFLSHDTNSYRPPRRGEIREGVIVSVSPSEILIDVGAKTEGVVSSRDMDQMDPETLESLHEGDSVLAFVVRPGDQDKPLVLSLKRAEIEKDWRSAEKIYKAGEPFDAKITGFNKGGLLVHIGQVRGFVPMSLLAKAPKYRPTAEGSEEESPLACFVGRESRFKIIELDRKRNRLILSERAATRELRAGRKEQLLEELKEGETRRGVVSNLCSFGAFVDLGGADGLIHISELSWGRVSHPSDLLSVGKEIDVFVLSIDRERRRIALSLKRLEPEPWSRIDEDYHVDQIVQGTITRLTDFGAFARLENNIEGLIHISELSDQHIAHPREIVAEGETHTLQVIRVDRERRRIGLSLRRVMESAREEDQPIGRRERGPIGRRERGPIGRRERGPTCGRGRGPTCGRGRDPIGGRERGPG